MIFKGHPFENQENVEENINKKKKKKTKTKILHDCSGNNNNINKQKILAWTCKQRCQTPSTKIKKSINILNVIRMSKIA